MQIVDAAIVRHYYCDIKVTLLIIANTNVNISHLRSDKIQLILLYLHSKEPRAIIPDGVVALLVLISLQDEQTTLRDIFPPP